MNRRLFPALVCLFASVLAVFSAAQLQAASPTLNLILPRGIERGKTHELRFIGARLDDAQEILFYDSGLTVEKIEQIEKANGNQIKVTVNVAADCVLGEHIAQVRCASGLSDFRSFFVGALEAVAEVEPNSSIDEPQAIPLNRTVEGTIENEDVDYFVVEAKKRDRIVAEVEAIRLGTFLFDPYVAILDEKRFELSAEDDTPLLRQDSLASIVAPEDGKYFIQLRETSYGGNGNCRYRVHIGNFPRPTAVYPAGGKKGEEVEVRCIGDPRGEFAIKTTVPTETRIQYGIFPTDEFGIAPSANPFRAFDHGNAFEAEPNNDFSVATPAELPLAFNGIISEPGDIDCFKFSATKGQVYEVECYARRIRSGLDPVMNIYNASGGGIAGNDDSRGPDSYIRFTAPEDGEYFVRITDHLQRGQADFVYRVEFSPVAPALTLNIPEVGRYSQDRQFIIVPRGNRFATLMNVSRANFGGPITVEGNELPPGVTMVAETMADSMSQMPIVFEAAADAPLGGKLVDFRGRHAENAEINGGYFNSAYFVRGNNNQMFIAGETDRLPIVVVDEVPFTLEIVQPSVPLVRNGSMNLKVIAHRKEGFTAPINVEFPFRPPGIGVSQTVQIPEGQSECLYPVNANGNAPVRSWPIYVLGNADVGGATWVSSQMAQLNVAEPFVNVELQRVSCEQGQEVQLFCKLTVAQPFEGEAKLEVIGLPPKVTVDTLAFNKETQELAFKIKTEAESPEGKHKNIFCRVIIPQGGEEIVASSGNTELQIDKPLPAPVAAPAQPAQVAATTPVTPPPAQVEKPLSRLEKLRLEAQKAKEASASQ
jgi:hypothetical protein